MGSVILLLLVTFVYQSTDGFVGGNIPVPTPSPTVHPTVTPSPTPWGGGGGGGGGGGSTPTPTPTPTSPPSSTQGVFLIYFNDQFQDGNGNPSDALMRIGAAYKTYGNPQMVIIANGCDGNGNAGWLVPNKFIDYMHTHYGIKIIVHPHTMGGPDLGGYSLASVKGQIDYQMNGGNHLDGFEFDESNPSGTTTNLAYYNALRNYVLSYNSGLIVSANIGGGSVSNEFAAIPWTWINTEAATNQFYNGGGTGHNDNFFAHSYSLIDTYPHKWMGIVSDYYIYIRCYLNGPEYFPGALFSTEQTYPITESQAVNIVHDAWNHGIYYYGVMWDRPITNPPSGNNFGFPVAWQWEDFLSQL